MAIKSDLTGNLYSMMEYSFFLGWFDEYENHLNGTPMGDFESTCWTVLNKTAPRRYETLKRVGQGVLSFTHYCVSHFQCAIKLITHKDIFPPKNVLLIFSKVANNSGLIYLLLNWSVHLTFFCVDNAQYFKTVSWIQLVDELGMESNLEKGRRRISEEEQCRAEQNLHPRQ